jgi:hypothetical protein
MKDNRDEFEPIIATRPRREPVPEETQPLWRLALALGGALAVAVLLVAWWMGRSSSDGESTSAQTKSSPEAFPEVNVEQAPAPSANELEENADPAPATPPAQDLEANADLPSAAPPSAPLEEPAASAEQPVPPENIPEAVSNGADQSPSPPATVSLRLMSPDTQVQFELRGPLDSSPPVTSKAGDVVNLAPGTYRVVASGAQLETIEQEITLTGERPTEYTVELCAQPKRELGTLAGQVVEERACTSTLECESMFTVLSEHADQLVKDPAFRQQECAKWRPGAAPEGRWTVDTKCDGATLATTCRIEIAQGTCAVAEPRRSVRGGECPRAELR